MTTPWNKRRARNRLKRQGLDPASVRAWLGLHERAWFAHRFLKDPKGRPWTARDYQAASLESHALRKVHCDGRDVGKTSEIEIVAAWAAVVRPDTELLIATQCENHLFPLMHRLVRRFQSAPELAPDLVELKRSPSWFLRFSNGFLLWGRIAGPHGMNFQGLHVDWQIVDEAQEMTEPAWAELYQALNGGGRRWVYGVPNGLRNSFYRMTRMPEVEQYNWPSSFNPEFSPHKDAELALLYGGRDSPGYIHRVLGQHGSPAHAVFNLDDYLDCVDDGLDAADIRLEEGDALDLPGPVPPGAYYLGCDLGYARDPSEFVVFRSAPPHLVNVLRVHLRGVNYARQQALIEAIDRAYRLRRIGIDCGNSGRAVAHNLMAIGPDWCEKVRAFEFGAAIDLDPLPDGRPQRRQTKQFMTELIERAMADRAIVFPRLPDRESQYASHTYSIGTAGQIVYEKGNDHLIDADRCAVLAHYLDVREPAAAFLGVRVEPF
ncbi:MAG: hypothetical protein JXR94_14135 [Candidatus Hydrogenedentes bacterium]|nr:hypothetical protein [Candidatus Hydrogenedentota bacterium]